MLVMVWLVVGFITYQVSGQLDCQPCECCKNAECTNAGNDTCNNGCKDGFWGDSCRYKCANLCLSCSQDLGYNLLCTKCKEGFYIFLYSNQLYGQCSRCQDRCSTCKSWSDCQTCKDGYYNGLSNGQVTTDCRLTCPNNCKSCNSISDQTCNQCIDGYFGQTCTQPCPANCLDGKCNLSDGECIACINGFSGGTCNNICQNNCLNRSCNIDGSCVSCEPGFHGSYCNNRCPPNCVTCKSSSLCTSCQTGYYGNSCYSQCFNCLEGTPCRQDDGYCNNGCKDGWTFGNCRTSCSPQCKACEQTGYYKCTKCVDGRYGTTYLDYRNSYLLCTFVCSSNCMNSTCDERTGACVSGCVKGRWGQICSDICPENCLNEECYQTNGSCLKGCKEGYKGNLCNCPTNCECDETGRCTGCETGFANTDSSCTCRTDLCFDESCSRCTNNSYFTHERYCCPCSSNCKEGTCVSASNCSYGCKSGYYDDGCDKMCADVDQLCTECPIKYGNQNYGCSLCKPGYYPAENTVSNFNRCMRCQNTCLDSECDGTNGICIKGCVNRKWGLTCQEDCPTNCLKCNRSNGKCSVCKGGTYLSNCSQPCSASCNKTEGYLQCEMETGACLSGCLAITYMGNTVIRTAAERVRTMFATGKRANASKDVQLTSGENSVKTFVVTIASRLKDRAYAMNQTVTV